MIKTRIVHIFELDWTSRVEELIPDRKIRIQFLDGFFAGGTEIWELESVGEYTRVTHTIIVKPKGLVSQLAWILKVRLKHNKMVEALLDNLEEVSETVGEVRGFAPIGRLARRPRFSPRRRIVPLRAGGQPVGLTGRRVGPTPRRGHNKKKIPIPNAHEETIGYVSL
jgi:hypothetical protein